MSHEQNTITSYIKITETHVLPRRVGMQKQHTFNVYAKAKERSLKGQKQFKGKATSETHPKPNENSQPEPSTDSINPETRQPKQKTKFLGFRA